MSFGVASCSDILEKGQKSDEYESVGIEEQSGFEHRNRWVDGEDSASSPMEFLL